MVDLDGVGLSSLLLAKMSLTTVLEIWRSQQKCSEPFELSVFAAMRLLCLQNQGLSRDLRLFSRGLIVTPRVSTLRSQEAGSQDITLSTA